MSDNKNPRYWSNKFWLKNNINDKLKEVVEPEQVDVSSIKFNDELSPLIWDDDNQLKNDVREILLLNAKRFIEFCGLDDIEFNDIIMTGSMANYNYNDNSDIDIHIILDFNQISVNKEFVGDYFKLKKQLWAEKLPIQVKGHDVELYYQDSSESHHSTGIYSLMNDEWIVKPTKKIININTPDIQLKSSDLMNSIDELNDYKNDENFLKKYEQLKNKIKKYRQSGLDKSGEYSTENLVFKILRNNGYLNKLIEMKNKYLTNELSLDEILIN